MDLNTSNSSTHTIVIIVSASSVKQEEIIEFWWGSILESNTFKDGEISCKVMLTEL
jgi:hypothetical protein